jgi:hypothetical protein
MKVHKTGFCRFDSVDLASKKIGKAYGYREYSEVAITYAYYPLDSPTVEIGYTTAERIAREGVVVSAYPKDYKFGDDFYTVRWGGHYFRVCPSFRRFK